MQITLLTISSFTFYALLACATLSLVILLNELIPKALVKVKCRKSVTGKKLVRRAPGPRPLPIIGNLSVLDGYEVPYQAFSDLRDKYGPVISLQLGAIPAIVVNGVDNIKEVLITKTSHFDSRPNFQRYHQLFSGNKENSLAFCDWSEVHKQRREMLAPHTFPKNFSDRFKQFDSIITEELGLTILNKTKDLEKEIPLPKQAILKYCCNIFTRYFCSKRFENDDPAFDIFISNFDKIFYEVNQGYAADFLPFLMPLHSKNLKQLESWSHEIRSILLEKIIKNRYTENAGDDDYLECLINYVKKLESGMDWNMGLFALEDIVGGHSAVGNFLGKVFGYILQDQKVQVEIQREAASVLHTSVQSNIRLQDRKLMPYTEAVIMESIRLIASPIVPHVSNQHSTIGGFDIEPNTLIFLNNYDLSMSPVLWDDPESFKPERFIRNGQLFKPDFFLPFGGGRRSCLGYKIVQLISFSTVANILKDFNIAALPGHVSKVQPGTLVTSEDCFKVCLIPRA